MITIADVVALVRADYDAIAASIGTLNECENLREALSFARAYDALSGDDEPANWGARLAELARREAPGVNVAHELCGLFDTVDLNDCRAPGVGGELPRIVVMPELLPGYYYVRCGGDLQLYDEDNCAADDANVFAANIIDDIRAAVRAEFARGE